MAERQSYHIKGMEHGAPIPNGARVGNIIFSSAFSGRDPQTGQVPSDPEEQAAVMFRNLAQFLEEAGASPDNVGHMTVFLAEEKNRDAINKEWIKMFPDEHNRPARHALKAELRGGLLFQVEIIAVV